MKTTISGKGVLQITPETEIELFALRHWFADYTAVPSRGTLQVVIVDDGLPDPQRGTIAS